MKNSKFVLLMVAFLTVLSSSAQNASSLETEKAYHLGFSVGLALDNMSRLSMETPLQLSPRMGYVYTLSYTSKPRFPVFLQYAASFTTKGFMQNSGSPYGNNVLFSMHYLELLPSVVYRIHPKLQIQGGFTAAFLISERYRSDTESGTLLKENRISPKPAIYFSPAIQFGKGVFYGRLSAAIGVFSTAHIRASTDGTVWISRARQQRLAFSLGYYFHR